MDMFVYGFCFGGIAVTSFVMLGAKLFGHIDFERGTYKK